MTEVKHESNNVDGRIPQGSHVKRTLRFRIHEITPLKPLGSGKYIGKNPFKKIKDDLIIDSSHDIIFIKSDNFAGTWSDFKKHYRMELSSLKPITNQNIRSIVTGPNLKIQKKLFALESELEELCKEIIKLHKKFDPILNASKISKHYFDTELDIVFQFYVSKKHSTYNPNDDNIVYEDDICKGEEIIRREKDYFNFKNFNPRYQRKKWSAIINYLYDNCSDEDILCIDRIFVEIKPTVQLSDKI